MHSIMHEYEGGGSIPNQSKCRIMLYVRIILMCCERACDSWNVQPPESHYKNTIHDTRSPLVLSFKK